MKIQHGLRNSSLKLWGYDSEYIGSGGGQGWSTGCFVDLIEFTVEQKNIR